MGMFSDWNKQEIDAVAFDEKGARQVYRFKRIMVLYSQMLFNDASPEDIKRELEVWEQDVKNFHIEYPRFREYLRNLTTSRTLAMQIDKNYCIGKLFHGSEGNIELSVSQLKALELLLKALGVIGPSKSGKADEPVTSFSIVEKGESK